MKERVWGSNGWKSLGCTARIPRLPDVRKCNKSVFGGVGPLWLYGRNWRTSNEAEFRLLFVRSCPDMGEGRSKKMPENRKRRQVKERITPTNESVKC